MTNQYTEEIMNKSKVVDWRILEMASHYLTPKEIRILELRYCLRDPLTLLQVGKLHEVTRERIRQIEAVALEKIRRNIKAG